MAEIREQTSEHDHIEEHHGGSFKTYWIVAAILGVATIVEVLLSDYLHGQGVRGGPLVGSMMGIAIFKATLVVMFYMHLKYEKKILWWTMLFPLILVLLLMMVLFAQTG